MHIFTSFEIRAHPETRPSCSTGNELEFMASLLLGASSGNKFYPIEPGPNPKLYRKVFENSILIGAARFGAYLDTMG